MMPSVPCDDGPGPGLVAPDPSDARRGAGTGRARPLTPVVPQPGSVRPSDRPIVSLWFVKFQIFFLNSQMFKKSFKIISTPKTFADWPVAGSRRGVGVHKAPEAGSRGRGSCDIATFGEGGRWEIVPGIEAAATPRFMSTL
eukprot:763576-Hanusia_phi.AAC.5